MELPRKDSNWELIALLTSPRTYYRLVSEKWVLLLSMVFGPERDARFFFLLQIDKGRYGEYFSMDIQAKREKEKRRLTHS